MADLVAATRRFDQRHSLRLDTAAPHNGICPREVCDEAAATLGSRAPRLRGPALSGHRSRRFAITGSVRTQAVPQVGLTDYGQVVEAFNGGADEHGRAALRCPPTSNPQSRSSTANGSAPSPQSTAAMRRRSVNVSPGARVTCRWLITQL